MKKAKTIQVSIVMTERELEAIDYVAVRLNMRRAQLLRNMIRMSMDEMRVLKYSGIADIIALLRSVRIHDKKVPEIALSDLA